MSRYVDENGFPLDGDCESKHTLSDNEIIKALERCADDDSCNDCGFVYGDCNCGTYRLSLMQHALSLINRQKAEIEGLKFIISRAPKAKSEAIKEFADKLRTRVSGVGTHSAIDCVLKEMVGDDE